MMGMRTVEDVISEFAGDDIHPADVCKVLEEMLGRGQDSMAVYRALAACRAVMCRLDPATAIPAVPKWV